jgi:hypothetical protein
MISTRSILPPALLLAALSLSACVSSYRPNITSAVGSSYDTDLKACRDQAYELAKKGEHGAAGATMIFPLFGLFVETQGTNPGSYVGMTKNIDECMRGKGYQVAEKGS